MKELLHGSCLCGAIRYEVRGEAIWMGHCHCEICRKQHGAAFATYIEIPPRALRLTAGEEALRSYASSAPVRRQFCGNCGSSLFDRYDGERERVWIAAGTLDDDPGVRPREHIFVGSKAPWTQIADGLPQHQEFP